MKNVCIIGAGNIGSRHLQGLKKVKFPLLIEVVDPSTESLKIASQRYQQIDSTTNHKISFLQDISNLSKKIDLAIVATNSDVRRLVIEKLLQRSSVKYLLLEKTLFQKKEDYPYVENLLLKNNVKTWVNFSMRTIPFYHDLKGKLNTPLQMVVSGSQYGLVTNTIHFVDYIAYLTNSYNFKVSTDGLDQKVIVSKRSGFSELNGTLSIRFKDGSTGSFTCYPDGDAPYIIEVFSKNYRCISRENDRKAEISSSPTWEWQVLDSHIPYQSDMTNTVVEEILMKGTSPLTPYTHALHLHLQLFESLLKFLNASSKRKLNLYPFT